MLISSTLVALSDRRSTKVEEISMLWWLCQTKRHGMEFRQLGSCTQEQLTRTRWFWPDFDAGRADLEKVVLEFGPCGPFSKF
jgi:hypothetical protein